MNQALTINQILNWDGTKYTFLEKCINDSINIYIPLMEPTWNTFIAPFTQFIINKLTLSIKAIGAFESLFDLETSQNMVLKLTNEKIQELITKTFNSKLMLDKSWTDFNELGNIQTVSDSSLGYQGYNVSNQDGQFTQSKNNSKSFGGAGKIQFIMFLNDTTNNFVEIYVKDMIKSMCRIIY